MSDTITVFDLISALRLFVHNEHEIQTPVTIGDITVIKENGSIRVCKTTGVVTEAELLALGFDGVGLVGSVITGDPTVKANVREVAEQFGIKPDIPFDVVDKYFNNQKGICERKEEQKMLEIEKIEEELNPNLTEEERTAALNSLQCRLCPANCNQQCNHTSDDCRRNHLQGKCESIKTQGKSDEEIDDWIANQDEF